MAAVVLLLLSVVDMWKLDLGLAPYTVTAAVGILTLAVIIRRNSVIRILMPGINKR